MQKIIKLSLLLVLSATSQASVMLKESYIRPGSYVYVDTLKKGVVTSSILKDKNIKLTLEKINTKEGELDFQLEDPNHQISRIVMSENGNDFGRVMSKVNDHTIKGHLYSNHKFGDHAALKIYFTAVDRLLTPHYLFSWPGDTDKRSRLWIAVEDPAIPAAQQYRIVLNSAQDNLGHGLAYSSPWLPLPQKYIGDANQKRVFPVGVANPPMNTKELVNIDGEVQLNTKHHETVAVTDLQKGPVKNKTLKNIGLDLNVDDLDAENNCIQLSYKDPKHLLIGVELKHPNVKMTQVSHHQESKNDDYRYTFCSNVPLDEDKTFMQLQVVKNSEMKRIPFHINKIPLNREQVIG